MSLTHVTGPGAFNALERHWKVSNTIPKLDFSRLGRDSANDLETAFALFFLDWMNAHGLK